MRREEEGEGCDGEPEEGFGECELDEDDCAPERNSCFVVFAVVRVSVAASSSLSGIASRVSLLREERTGRRCYEPE